MSDHTDQKISNPKQISQEQTIPAFLKKTYEILENASLSDIICWSDDGLSIILKNTEEFTQKILPQYFKHNNLTSFIRQLNMYDFHKKKNPFYENVFSNEMFQRGRKELLKEIKRKNPEASGPNTKIKALLENEQVKHDISNLFQENIYLKKNQQELIERIRFLENRLSEYAIQNRNLWLNIINFNNSKNEATNLLQKCLDIYGLEYMKIFIAARENEFKNIIQERQKGFVPHQLSNTDYETLKKSVNIQVTADIKPLINLVNSIKETKNIELDSSKDHKNAEKLLTSDLHKINSKAKRELENQNSIPSLQYLTKKHQIIMKNAIPVSTSKPNNNEPNLTMGFSISPNLEIPSFYQEVYENNPKGCSETMNSNPLHEFYYDAKLLGKRKNEFDKQHNAAREFHLNLKDLNGDSFYEKIYKLHKNGMNILDSDSSTNDDRNRSCKSEDAYYEEDDGPNLKSINLPNLAESGQ